MPYTDEELAGLSDEEREAVLDEDDKVDEIHAEELDETEDEEAEESEDEVEETEEEVEEDEQEEEIVEVKEEKPEPTKEPETHAELKIRLPDDIAEQFSQKLEDLQAKFDEGDLTMSQLLNERDKINRQIYNAEAEQAEQIKAANEWQAAQDVFLAANPEYLKAENKERYLDLSDCVKAVVNKAKSLPDALARAKKMEEAMNGPLSQKVEVKPEPREKSKKPEIPTLSDIPAAAENDTNKTDEFAYLDKLDGLELETALAQLSESKQEKYLSR